MNRLTSGAVALAIALTACSGGQLVAPPTLSPTTNVGQRPLPKRGRVELHIKVPRKQHRHRGLHARYISPNTQSVVITTQETATCTSAANARFGR